jgi:hypothetical protein
VASRIMKDPEASSSARDARQSVTNESAAQEEAKRAQVGQCLEVADADGRRSALT